MAGKSRCGFGSSTWQPVQTSLAMKLPVALKSTVVPTVKVSVRLISAICSAMIISVRLISAIALDWLALDWLASEAAPLLCNAVTRFAMVVAIRLESAVGTAMEITIRFVSAVATTMIITIRFIAAVVSIGNNWKQNCNCRHQCCPLQLIHFHLLVGLAIAFLNATERTVAR